MAHLLLLVLLGLVAEDSDLLALAVLDDLSLDGSTLNSGSADLGVLTIQHSQNLLELHGSASLSLQLLDVQDITLGDGLLLTTGHDNCFHFFFTYFILCSLALKAWTIKTQLKPIQCG